MERSLQFEPDIRPNVPVMAAMRSKALFREGAFEGGRDFFVLIPRVMIGVVGSGYIAAVMPADLITTWIGPKSGLLRELLNSS